MSRRLWIRTLHWCMVGLFLFAAFLAMMNQYFYSKEAIMEVFDYAFGAMGYEIMPADQLFAARMLRRVGWLWHFWTAGTAFLLFAVMVGMRRNEHSAYRLFGPLLLVMAVSGAILFIREFVDIDLWVIDTARTIHHYAAWLLLPALFWHLRGVLRPYYVVLPLALTLIPEPAAAYQIKRVAPPSQCGNDALCIEGSDYLHGRKGVTYIEKVIPSCPYERCREVSRGDGRHIDKGDKRILRIQRRDYATAVSLLRRSACELKNDYAAKLLYEFLSKQVNLRDRRPDPILIQKMEKRLQIDYDDYLGLLACLLRQMGGHPPFGDIPHIIKEMMKSSPNGKNKIPNKK